jgi:hypothetical protein
VQLEQVVGGNQPRTVLAPESPLARPAAGSHPTLN